MLENIIRFFIINLVDKPDSIVIKQINKDGKYIIEVKVAPKDLAKVIGKDGRVFRALKSIINIIEPNIKKDLVINSDALS